MIDEYVQGISTAKTQWNPDISKSQFGFLEALGNLGLCPVPRPGTWHDIAQLALAHSSPFRAPFIGSGLALPRLLFQKAVKNIFSLFSLNLLPQLQDYAEMLRLHHLDHTRVTT